LYGAVKPIPSTYKIWLQQKKKGKEEGKQECNIANIKKSGSRTFVIGRP
jgi:hypothetical protein